MSTNEAKLLDSIPASISTFEVLNLIKQSQINSSHLKLVKKVSDLSDEKLSASYNLNVKTFRTYKNSKAALKADLQEHTIMLLSLIKHGIEVFGTTESFNRWLEHENYFLGQKKPIEYLNTISGIKFIDNRLTGIEYGDNA
ncbi:MAG: DUF2384 domain-containing protein [Bacteroidetes bacterium]|nr:DUF2384 domain-containing protein [Bacteroidota bacterium]